MRLEVVGTRKNGRARRRHARRHACLPRACPFSLSPTTSKRLLRRLAADVITVLQGIFQLPIVWKLHRWKDSSCEEYFPFDRSSSFPSLLKIQNGVPDIAVPGSGESLRKLVNVNVFQREKWTTFPKFQSRSETPENVFHFWNIYNRQQNC